MANVRASRQMRRPHELTSRRSGGFTLAELLIVIAIIAVLIGILLPALSAARRSSASVKCLASLKQIGTAFQMYAQENKRWFPVVRWNPVTSGLPSAYGGGGINPNEEPANTQERIWLDFLAKYLVKKETYGNPVRYAEFQNNSVFWGCPSFNTALFDPAAPLPSPSEGSKRYSMSYGMSRLALGPYKVGLAVEGTPLAAPTPAGVTAPYLNYAEIATVRGQFFKMEQWGRRSQGKGLVFDSNGFNVVASTSWTKLQELAGNSPQAQTQPGSMGIDYPATALTGSYINIDATRHASPTANRQKIMQSRGANCLFVDGHAAPVTPREAWIAVWGAGVDLTQ